jgi:hypothetical protein
MSEVPGLITCFTLSALLNLSIDLSSLTVAKSNYHIHKNLDACGSAALNPKATHVMTHSNPSPHWAAFFLFQLRLVNSSFTLGIDYVNTLAVQVAVCNAASGHGCTECRLWLVLESYVNLQAPNVLASLWTGTFKFDILVHHLLKSHSVDHIKETVTRH